MLELSYCLDCADGMLARHKKLASKAGHLFDFFTDELKAVLLVGALALRAWRAGGYGLDGRIVEPGDARFLLAGIAGVAVVASAHLAHQLRAEPRGERTRDDGRGALRDGGAEARRSARSSRRSCASSNHYPSHIWIWALAGRLELYFWLWMALNALYLARGWLGLLMRFGRG